MQCKNWRKNKKSNPPNPFSKYYFSPWKENIKLSDWHHSVTRCWNKKWPKSRNSSFYLRVDAFKIAKKVPKYLVHFLYESLRPRIFKIAQSGHTGERITTKNIHWSWSFVRCEILLNDIISGQNNNNGITMIWHFSMRISVVSDCQIGSCRKIIQMSSTGSIQFIFTKKRWSWNRNFAELNIRKIHLKWCSSESMFPTPKQLLQWNAHNLIWAYPGLLFRLYRPFLIPITIIVSISTIYIEKSIYGVLGIRTQGHTMVGTDETSELRQQQTWR